MKKTFVVPFFLISFIAYAQPNRLKLINAEKGKTTFIREGDKVLMALKVARDQALKKPSCIYLLSKPE